MFFANQKIFMEFQVLNRFYHLDDNGIMDDNGAPQLFFAKPAFTIAKKQMNERIINSLLRNAWIG